MTAHTTIDTDILASVRAEAARHSYHPRGTVRCVSVPLFRNTLVRACACLLDFDPDVLLWSDLPLEACGCRVIPCPRFQDRAGDRSGARRRLPIIDSSYYGRLNKILENRINGHVS